MEVVSIVAEKENYITLAVELEPEHLYKMDLIITKIKEQDTVCHSVYEESFQIIRTDYKYDFLINISVPGKWQGCRILLRFYREGRLEHQQLVITKGDDNIRSGEKIEVTFSGSAWQPEECVIQCETVGVCRALRNSACSWRKEEEHKVSIYDSKGKLIVLKGQMADIWMHCRESNTIAQISKKSAISLDTVLLALKILERSDLIKTYKWKEG